MNFRVSKVRLELYILSLLQYKIKSFSLIWLSLSLSSYSWVEYLCFLFKPPALLSLSANWHDFSDEDAPFPRQQYHALCPIFILDMEDFFLYKSNTDDITI